MRYAMLNRQKVVLLMLKLAGRPVSRTELTKWCFLLRHESATGGGQSFYDFVPYRFGPFSFALYQETEKLVCSNHVNDDGRNYWSFNPDLENTSRPCDRDVETDVRQILTRYQKYEIASLVDTVYERHPAFTVNSERRRLAPRPCARPAIYTAGYEGLSIDAFLNLLVSSGIQRLIDVRNNPIARRYGFHKSTLTRLTSRLNIDYVHLPELGIRSADRQGLTDQLAYERLFDTYEKSVLTEQPEAINAVSRLVNQLPSVLVCMESNPRCCHRSRLAEKVARQTNLVIQHLLGGQ